ncbi:MAG TPA: thiamine biosynthesis protein ThiF [Bacteroidales bacterium]|nr:thiamine biosynthesis protein ThiF [Bacteroidales bacterium]
MNIYDRHISLFSKEEFELIRNAKIAVAGSGGLGSTVLQLLARIGFGTIYFWDCALVDLPDLNRQLLYKTNDLGKKKTEAALNELKLINPNLNLIGFAEKLEKSSIVPEVDLVIDCLDNFDSRLSLDYLFFERGVPIIHGSVFMEMGQVTTLLPGKTPNYQDTFGVEGDQEENEIKSVFPPIVTIVASMQVSEATKYISNRHDLLLLNKLMIINLKKNQFELFPLT